jgi:acyl carrier protein
MAETHSKQGGTSDRIKAILRRDLKLPENAVIEDAMPLVGGQFDLDSLDILLLVTSVEKEFGIKIASEKIGREAFTSVATLSRFVDGLVLGR